MAADGLRRTLGRLANGIGIAGALLALGLVGYFASLGLRLMRQ